MEGQGGGAEEEQPAGEGHQHVRHRGFLEKSPETQVKEGAITTEHSSS